MNASISAGATVRVLQDARRGLWSRPMQVVAVCDHRPKDGPPERAVLAVLSDGSKEFIWNLALV